MDFTTAWEKQPSEPQEIAGERRGDRRYGIQLDLKWKLVRRRRVLETGVGRTVDLSSSGILFNAGRPLPEGLNVELSIAWPVLLHNVAPLQLTVAGRIVRCEGRVIGVQMVQHEFRTVSTPPEHRAALSIAARTTSGPLAPTGVNHVVDNGVDNGVNGGLGKPQ